MKYNKIIRGIFHNRPNRFIANVYINGELETVHVKNTGRCKELLIPGVEVILEVSDNPARKTKYDIIEAFSFLNESRKNQLIKLFEATGELPLYFKGDEEMYLKAGDLPDGSLFCAAFNLGTDPIDNLELVIYRDVNKIEKLNPEGKKEERHCPSPLRGREHCADL